MIYPPYCLRISKESREVLDLCRREYGADDGLNRFIEALCQYCLTGEPEINGINIRSFFEDALSGRLSEPGNIQSKLREAEEHEYAAYADFLKGDFGDSLLLMMCEKDTAASFFADAPNWLGILQEQFLASENGLPLRISAIRKYTARWYQERVDDGSAAEYLKQNIDNRRKRRAEA